MEIITTFDFVSMFPAGQRVAIIGNAPSVMLRKLGKLIDGYDIVVRFNECAVLGYEEYVGSRADILVANPYPEKKVRLIADGLPTKLVIIITPQTRRGDKAVFSRWLGHRRVMFTYSPALFGVADSSSVAGLTTGTYGIQLITRVLAPSNVLVTGFTMFDDPNKSHYWHDGAEPGVKHHDLEREAVIFVNLLNSIQASVEITAEISAVAKRAGVTLGSHLTLYDPPGTWQPPASPTNHGPNGPILPRESRE